jgi:nucleoside-diphosphate-sugar epimerase
MRILVTGAGGFLGRAVVRAALARGHAVTALVRGAAEGWPAEVRVLRADLARDAGLAALVAGQDVVVHCAASLGTDAEEQQRDTVDATRNLLAALASARVPRLVLASSIAVIDHLRCGERVDESAPLEPDPAVRGPYIGAKLEHERMARASGLDVRILRPGLVRGPEREWFYQLGLALGARLWIALAGSARLPLVHVDDCAQAFVLAAEVERGGFTLHVVDERAPTRADYLRSLSARSTPRKLVLSLPWGVLRVLARCANLVGVRAGMLHPARLAARCRPLVWSSAAAQRTLGWAPTKS